jgi:GPH family glycoside/pentoside/hexuronide:cation symporter
MSSHPKERSNLSAYALFAGVLSAAGLPIYMHAPKFFFDQYGVGLGALGAVLFGLRLLDVVQDPALGWFSGRVKRRATLIAVVGSTMAAAMLGVFALAPPVPPLVWFAFSLGCSPPRSVSCRLRSTHKALQRSNARLMSVMFGWQHGEKRAL